MKKEIITCRVEPELIANLVRFAEIHSIRQSDLVREALREKITRLIVEYDAKNNLRVPLAT